jgi:pimeloyl-ACP methyl ester carboxylesterase
MKTIVDNLAVEYKDEGQGPVLLMLHGWGNNLSYLDPLVTRLGEFRIIRLDLPGFGSSETPHEPWNIERYARFVTDFCKKIDVIPDFLLGHSFGGRITIKATGAQILHAKKIVLIDAAGVAEPQSVKLLLSATVAKAGKLLLRPFPSTYLRARRFLYEKTGSDYLQTAGLADTFVLTIRENLSTDAGRITAPTLLIWGENDMPTPLSQGKKLHALIRGSKLEVIPKAGHFVYREHPDEVAKLIKEFLV